MITTNDAVFKIQDGCVLDQPAPILQNSHRQTTFQSSKPITRNNNYTGFGSAHQGGSKAQTGESHYSHYQTVFNNKNKIVSLRSTTESNGVNWAESSTNGRRKGYGLISSRYQHQVQSSFLPIYSIPAKSMANVNQKSVFLGQRLNPQARTKIF